MKEILKILKPLYLNCKDYYSKDWRFKEDCEIFSNRKLCDEEIVADFDKLSNIWTDLAKIIKFFESKRLKYWVYQSGVAGLHVHFFVSGVKTKHQKAKLLEILSNQSGYGIDIGPVKRGWIRAEDSLHPTKGFKKVLLYSNVHQLAYLGRDFYTNYIFGHNAQKVFNSGFSEGVRVSKELDSPKTIDIMLNTRFNDGIKRVLFCLISYWKSKKLSDDKIFNRAKLWLDFQQSNILDSHIEATIRCSSGLVRDNYRQNLLMELGFGEKLKPFNQVESEGF